MAYEWKYADAFDLTNSSMHENLEKRFLFEYHIPDWLFFTVSIGCSVAIFGGAFTNIFALVVLVRSRLWLKHEGYVYLAANFCANLGILLFDVYSFWMTSAYGGRYYYPPNTSNFMCKVWHFLMSIFYVPVWLSVALLFNVYLREHLTHRRRSGCPMFAAKYCTLFATKIIVGVIFILFAVLGTPYLALYEIQFGGTCFTSQPGSLYVSALVEWFVMWVLPSVCLLVILLAMLCTKKGDNIVEFSQIAERLVSDDQMKMLAVTLSSMTLFPQFHLILQRFGYVNSWLAQIVAELAYGLSIGLQPILCFIILKALRHGLVRCCCRRVQSLDRDEEVVQLNNIQVNPPNPTGSLHTSRH